MKSTVNILVIDKSRLFLGGIVELFSKDKVFNVAGKLTDAALAMDFLADNGGVNLILSDAGIFEYIAPIKRSYPKIKIVVWGESTETALATRAHAAGADSFVSKNISVEELKEIIAATLGGSGGGFAIPKVI